MVMEYCIGSASNLLEGWFVFVSCYCVKTTDYLMLTGAGYSMWNINGKSKGLSACCSPADTTHWPAVLYYHENVIWLTWANGNTAHYVTILLSFCIYSRPVNPHRIHRNFCITPYGSWCPYYLIAHWHCHRCFIQLLLFFFKFKLSQFILNYHTDWFHSQQFHLSSTLFFVSFKVYPHMRLNAHFTTV